jgi:hypothetical protein
VEILGIFRVHIVYFGVFLAVSNATATTDIIDVVVVVRGIW